MKDLNRREAAMLHFYTKLGEVHTEDYREIMNLLYFFDVMPPEQREEFKLTSLEVAALRNTLKESALEVFHNFLGITEWEINKDNYEKAREKYQEKNMGNAYLAIMCELFKDREQKDWLSVTQGDIREAKDKVLILFMKDFFKEGKIETKEEERSFVDKLKVLNLYMKDFFKEGKTRTKEEEQAFADKLKEFEVEAPKREAKRIQSFVALFEKYRKDQESNEQSFVDKLKELEAEAPKVDAKSIESFVALFEKFKKK
jgi:predicted ribonuclease YlaK